MKIFLFCIIAAMSFTIAANDELLDELADEKLHNLLACPQVGNVDENCKKQKALLSESMAKLSEDDQERVRNLATAKFVLEMEKAKKKEEERKKLRQERASLADPGDTIKKLAEESFELFAKCKNKQLDEGECKKKEKLLLEREKKLSVSDQEKLQAFVMQKLIEK